MSMDGRGPSSTDRAARWAFAVLLGLLFAAAVWFRVTSLEALPDIESDEAWYGVQAYRLGHGEPFEFRTPNCNPLNPLCTGLEVPLLWIFRPSYWILRAPAVIFGLLTIALTYVLGARLFGRRPALIASALWAALPIAILYSRKGYDCSPTPLMSLLLVYFAFKESRAGMLLSAIGALLSHPTNVFLFPIVATVYLARALPRRSGEPRRQWRVVLGTAACGLVVLACGLAILLRPRTNVLYDVLGIGGLTRGLVLKQAGGLAGAELSRVMTLVAELFVGCGSFGRAPAPWQVRGFWVVVSAVSIPGVFALVRTRRWDRVALVAGVFLGASALFLAVGPRALEPDANRYGLFLVLPAVLGFALLADALIAAPTTPLRTAALYIQCAALLAVGAGSLAAFKVNCFDANRGTSRAERVWTFRNDEKDVKCRALRLIEKDRELAAVRREAAGGGPAAAGPRPRRTIIFVQDWWTWWSVAFLALPYGDIEVRPFSEGYQCDHGRYWADVRRALAAGEGYVLALKGQDLERWARAEIPASTRKSWELVRYGDAATPVAFSSSVLVFRTALPTDPAPSTASRPVERK